LLVLSEKNARKKSSISLPMLALLDFIFPNFLISFLKATFINEKKSHSPLPPNLRLPKCSEYIKSNTKRAATQHAN